MEEYQAPKGDRRQYKRDNFDDFNEVCQEAIVKFDLISEEASLKGLY